MAEAHAADASNPLGALLSLSRGRTIPGTIATSAAPQAPMHASLLSTIVPGSAAAAAAAPGPAAAQSGSTTFAQMAAAHGGAGHGGAGGAAPPPGLAQMMGMLGTMRGQGGAMPPAPAPFNAGSFAPGAGTVAA